MLSVCEPSYGTKALCGCNNRWTPAEGSYCCRVIAFVSSPLTKTVGRFTGLTVESSPIVWTLWRYRAWVYTHTHTHTHTTHTHTYIHHTHTHTHTHARAGTYQMWPSGPSCLCIAINSGSPALGAASAAAPFSPKREVGYSVKSGYSSQRLG